MRGVLAANKQLETQLEQVRSQGKSSDLSGEEFITSPWSDIVEPDVSDQQSGFSIKRCRSSPEEQLNRKHSRDSRRQAPERNNNIGGRHRSMSGDKFYTPLT